MYTAVSASIAHVQGLSLSGERTLALGTWNVALRLSVSPRAYDLLKIGMP